MQTESKGMWLGLAGVAIFSLTLPFTRIAVTELNPAFVAFGRAVVAAFCSLGMLWHLKAPRPSWLQVRALLITSLGVVIGFPLFSSIAMHSVPASHGAVVLGMLPLAFALQQGGGGLQLADLALFAAVLAAAMGYAEGGRLAQTMGGQQVICWALVLSLPLLLPVSIWLGWRYGVDASPRVWLAFAYVSLFSMFIGFFFWYKGLALGGIARVGQVQLLQPFMSLLGAALIAGEVLEARNLLFSTAVIVVVAMGRKMSIRR